MHRDSRARRMPVAAVALLLATAGAGLCGPTGAEVSQQLRETELDPEACYRVRELSLRREDIKLFFNDGYLLFSKPVAGVRTIAVFSSDVEAGDGEILLIAPDRSERRSLAVHTGSPTLSEHFGSSVLVFADDTHDELMEQIRTCSSCRPVAEMGHALASQWNPTVRNLTTSFESRLVLDLLSPRRSTHGFLFGALSGKKLGNFDVVYDPRGREQITIGQTRYRDDRLSFDIWANFSARSFRSGQREENASEMILSDYRIDATLTPPELGMDVTTRIKMKVNGSGERVFPLDLSSRMRVTSATIDGMPVEVLQDESIRSNLIRNTGNSLFLLVSEKPLAPDQEHELEIRHSGHLIADAGNQVYLVVSRGGWYPSRGLQFAQFDLTFRYPSTLDLVSSGELISDEKGAEWRVTRSRTREPIRIAGFNLGVYQREKVARGGLTVEVCANQSIELALQPKPPPPMMMPVPVPGPRARSQPHMVALPPPPPPPLSPAARLREMAAEIAEAYEFMSRMLGPPPSPKLIVSPVPGTFGQGFPGLIYLSTLSYLGPKDRPIARMDQNLQVFFSEILHAHETAHQWWGNRVTSAGYHDEWLMESLANYTALLFLEKRKGAAALEAMLEEYRANLLREVDGKTVESAGPIALGMRLLSSDIPGAWRTITYEKGSWILHMLRQRMGDEQFRAMLAKLSQSYERKPIDTEQFRMLAAEFLPPKSPDAKLETFFDQWVYSTGIPELRLKYSTQGRAPRVQINGVVSQSKADEDFVALVPVEIHFNRGQPVTHWVRASSGDTPFTVRLKQLPTKILLDPHYAVLSVKK